MNRMLFALALWGLVALLPGCAASPVRFDESSLGLGSRAIEPPITPEADTPDQIEPRRLPMYTGTGAPMDWAALVEAMDWAQVIVLGEEHDDGVGHAFQRAVTEQALGGLGQRGALSMEMLERDEQALADDYLDGIIDAKTLETLSHSTDWGGKGSWSDWYQPIIDAAKTHGARLVAANAPRRYVRLARLDGYQRLDALPESRHRLFSLPHPLTDPGYRARFDEVMSGGHGPATAPADRSADAEQAMRRENGFRSQLLWDSTMADSIVRAHRSGARKIVHLIGQFHSDFNGGTVQQIRARWPSARILTVSMQRDDGQSLREEDQQRADIIVYTGRRPDPPATAPEDIESPHTQPHAPATQPEAPGTQPDAAATQPEMLPIFESPASQPGQ